MSAVAVEKLTVRRGVYLTNGKTLVVVKRVMPDSVLVLDAFEPVASEADAELLALTPQEVADQWEQVCFEEIEIPEEWRLTPIPESIAHLEDAAAEAESAVDESNPAGTKETHGG